jgi:DNA polymerase
MLDMLYDSVPGVLSELIRTAFIPRPGYKYIVSDFSAIEARVLSHLAGEKWRVDVFRNGRDIYCESASRMFGVPVEKHGQNADLRQKGKQATLSCGYGGSVGALRAMGALEAGMKEEELQPLVDFWRAANPNIVKFWWDVDRAAKDAIKQRTKVKVGLISFEAQSGMLFAHLPSGRRLSYVKPQIGENRFGGKSIVYEGVNSTTHQWDYIDTYGPRLVENIIQAIARDLLTEAILRISKNPDCKIVAHVHDEIIIEADPDKVTLDDMIKAMCILPDWGDGLILNAAGFTSPYYMKD